jgi:hypothetical protein
MDLVFAWSSTFTGFSVYGVFDEERCLMSGLAILRFPKNEIDRPIVEGTRCLAGDRQYAVNSGLPCSWDPLSMSQCINVVSKTSLAEKTSRDLAFQPNHVNPLACVLFRVFGMPLDEDTTKNRRDKTYGCLKIGLKSSRGRNFLLGSASRGIW